VDEDTAHLSATSDPVGRLADAVSVASDFGAAWVALCVVQILSPRRSSTAAVVRLGTAGLVSLLLTRCLKHFFGVPRDEGVPRATFARTPTSPGFPSGHTLAAFTAALTVPTSRSGRRVALAFAALVAWARVRVGHHKPADVVAGASAGALAGTVLRGVLRVAGGD
jgi:membrane-associated phospholipid phosphatase